jgi:hypothetical protein
MTHLKNWIRLLRYPVPKCLEQRLAGQPNRCHTRGVREEAALGIVALHFTPSEITGTFFSLS